MDISHREKLKLAIFDVEGVLIPKNRYLLFELGRNLRFSQFTRILLCGLLYELGLTSLESAMKQVFRSFEGFQIEDLLQIFRQIPLMPDVTEVFEKLKGAGFKIALISSGLPTFVVRDLASKLNADYAHGFELRIKDGLVTGEIWGEVIEHKGKLLILRRILETEGLTPKECVVVADDRNNAPMLLPKMLKIGYNPDFLIRIKADYVVSGHPLEVLSLIEGQINRTRTLPSKNEILRETIHASGLAIPIIASLASRYLVALLTLFVTLLYTVSELAMMEKRSFPIISSITHRATTREELHGFRAAPIFFGLGILFTLLLFTPPASNAAIAIFTLGDSAASIFGRILGNHTLPFNKGKSLEGSLVGFIFAFSAATFFTSPLKALVGALTAMIIEGIPSPISDNLTVPLLTGAVLTFMN